MKHWQIRFRNYADNLCTISIYDEDYTGPVIELTGSGDVFTTSEDSSSDVLSPIRSATGYISIIDKEHLYDAIPTSDTQYYVSLRDENYLLWEGFIQAQTIDGDMYDRYDEVRIPVVDALGVMDSIKMDVSDRNLDLSPIGSYITEAIDAVNAHGATIGNIVFPKEWTANGSSVFYEWMKIKANRYNFINSDNEQPDTHLAILKGIAEAFGWVVSVYRTTLVFQSMRDEAQYNLALLNPVKNYCAGLSSTLSTFNTNFNPIDISTLQSISTDNNKTIERGVGSVFVNVDPNVKDNGHIGLPSDGLVFKQYNLNENPNWRVLEYYDDTRYFRTYDHTIYAATNENMPKYPNACIGDSSYGPALGSIRTYMARYDADASADKKSYEYKAGILCWYDIPTYTVRGIERICPIYGMAHIVDIYGGVMAARRDGCIDVRFKGYNYGGVGGITTAFKVALRIGDYYIHRDADIFSFSKERVWLNPEWESDQFFDFHFKSNKTKNMLYVDAEDLCLPTARTNYMGELQQLAGDIFFELWLDCSDRVNHEWPAAAKAFFSIDELSVRYCESEYEYLQGIGKISKTFETTTDNTNGDITITPRICTKFPDIESGFAVLYNRTDSLKPGDFVKVTGHQSLEEALHDELSRCYIGRTIIAEPEVRAIPSLHATDILIEGERYHVLSTSTNWRDNTTKYKLAKIKSA